MPTEGELGSREGSPGLYRTHLHWITLSAFTVARYLKGEPTGEKMTSYVYVIKNITTGRIYVGKSDNPKSRWTEHVRIAMAGTSRYGDTYFARAIRKYGKQDFMFIGVIQCASVDDAFELEKRMIDEYRVANVPLYNMVDGGGGASNLSEEARSKRSAAHRGNYHSEESRAKIGDGHRGMSHTYKMVIRKAEAEVRRVRIAKEYGWDKPGYPPAFRALVLEDAAKSTDHVASEKHGIATCTICAWRKAAAKV